MKKISIILIGCLTLNACDPTFLGMGNNIKTLAELQKERDVEDKKREEKLLWQNVKSIGKKLKYTQAEARALYDENQQLKNKIAEDNGLCPKHHHQPH